MALIASFVVGRIEGFDICDVFISFLEVFEL